MVVSFRAASEDARGTTGKPIPAPPTGTTSGDLLLAIQTCDLNGSLATMTAPTGWIKQGEWPGTTGVGFMKVWTRDATASEPATYAFSDDTDSHGSVIILALTGYEPTAPLAVTPAFSTNTAATGHVAPSVTGVADGLLVTGYLAGTNGTNVTYTPPSGMTERRESGLTSSPNIRTMAATALLVDNSATGTRTATCSASMPYLATTMVVAPAGWAPPAPDPELTVEPVGIGSAAAVGTALVSQTLVATGVASSEVFGTATVSFASTAAQTVVPIGLASGQAFGIPGVVPAVAPGNGPYPDGGVYPGGVLYPGAATSVTTATTFPSLGTFPGLNTFPGSSNVTPSQTIGVLSIGSSETFGIPAFDADPLSPRVVTAIGVQSTEVFGEPTVTIPVGLFADDALYPSDTLYPRDGGEPPTGTTLLVVGIDSAEEIGLLLVELENGPQTVRTTAIELREAFGIPVVGAPPIDSDIAPPSIESDERFGRPRIQREVAAPVVTGEYFDTYFLDGIDLSTYAVQIEVAEGLQETPGVIGDNIALPGRDGALEVYGSFGQPRRTDGIGRITFSLWMIGVDPDTGEIPPGSFSAEQYFQRWDELVRLVHRRRVTIDHPRPDGTRRAIGHLMPGETIAPSSRSASPWFGRMKVTFAIPGAHWTELSTVTTGAQSLTSGGALSLAAFAASTAPCTDLTVRFGAGNNPRLSTSYNHVGWNGVIAPGFELGIDTTFGETHQASGAVWTPGYSGLTYSPGPRLFEIDPTEPMSAVLSHTTGGSMLVEVSGKRRYRTS